MMQTVTVKAKTSFLHNGEIKHRSSKEFEVSLSDFNALKARGLVEEATSPKSTKQPSASPAEEASQNQTATQSMRGRKRKEVTE